MTAVFLRATLAGMSWFTKPIVRELEPETVEQKRARLQREWRTAEEEFDLAFTRLARHDAHRQVLVAAQARAAERRNHLLDELAALAVKKNS